MPLHFYYYVCVDVVFGKVSHIHRAGFGGYFHYFRMLPIDQMIGSIDFQCTVDDCRYDGFSSVVY